MHKEFISTIIACLIVTTICSVSCTPSSSETSKSEAIESPAIETIEVQEETTVESEQISDNIVTEKEEEPEKIAEPEVTEEKPVPQPLPEEEPVPPHKYRELVDYALELINKDRLANGLNPVDLAGNTASQLHAEESLASGYSSHWNIEGLKPYMRYTLNGGVDYVGENVIGTGIETIGDSPATRDIEQLLKTAQEKFMESPVHRANILNKWHKKVSLGIAYDHNSFHWVQHFEGDYIGFSTRPAISGNVISMAGKLKTGSFERIVVYYDPLPQALTPVQLNSAPYDSSYTMGEERGNILPPLPAGKYYTNLRQTDVVATNWVLWDEGWFDITAEIGPILGKGKGVYTIVVLANIDGELLPVTNYSIFVR